MDLAGQNVLVVGLGRSGLAAARLCAARGARVTVTDHRSEAELSQAVQALAGRAGLELGGHRKESFACADLIVLSPGVPDIPELQAARAAGVRITGELELSWRFVQAEVAAITGTNGKSTTASLLGAMVARSGRPTFTGGNLGQPLAEAVGTAAAGPQGALVLEVSSFQLETSETFRPHVALLLNLSEDHLDRYPDYETYVAAKARIFCCQEPADFAVVNGLAEQERCRRLAAASRARVLTFQPERGEEGSAPAAWASDDRLWVQIPGAPARTLPRGALGLWGRHNLQNALAALLGAQLLGADVASCEQALRDFGGLPHRMEQLGEIAGVLFFNDSKATNVGSVVGSLTGFERPVVLIAGGKDKGGDYAPLADLVRQVARHVVLIGVAAERMARALAGAAPLHRAVDMEQAVRLAASLARPGDAVVLSPACSSYDMFANFEERGAVFADAVRALGKGR